MRRIERERKIMGALASHSGPGLSPRQISGQIGLLSTTVISDLIRLERDGCVESAWEGEQYPSEPTAEREDLPLLTDSSKPRRRLYRITENGHRARSDLAANTSSQPDDDGGAMPAPAPSPI